MPQTTALLVAAPSALYSSIQGEISSSAPRYSSEYSSQDSGMKNSQTPHANSSAPMMVKQPNAATLVCRSTPSTHGDAISHTPTSVLATSCQCFMCLFMSCLLA